jgi:peptidoglycan/LPS O-acetylase OafA/YrhL
VTTTGFPAPSGANKNYPLTSLRFFAATLVLYHHSVRVFLPGFSVQSASHGLPQEFVDVVSFNFTVSVSFFFLLSGYVLSQIYLGNGQPLDVRKFFVARLARLYPLYFVVQLLDSSEFLLSQIQSRGMRIGIANTAEVLVGNMLMLQVWIRRLNRINAPSWSLCCEIFFYLCFPLLGVLLWKLRGAHLWVTALALYVGGQALVMAVRPHVGLTRALTLPLLHLSTFALGILLARGRSLQRDRPDKAPVRAWHVYTVLAVSVIGLLLSVPLQALFHVSHPYNNGMLAPLFASIIWALSAIPTAVSRLLCARWLFTLGNASYALYLIHYPIIDLFQYLHWESVIFYPVYVALCIGLSLLSFHYFETPTRLWLIERLQERRQEAAAASS